MAGFFYTHRKSLDGFPEPLVPAAKSKTAQISKPLRYSGADEIG